MTARSKTIWLAALALLATVVCAGAEEPAPPGDELARFAWTKRDEKRLAVLERKVQHDELYDMWVLEGEEWKVEAGPSARFAAETLLFVEKLQAVFDKLVTRERRVRAFHPTVVIFSDETRFRELHNEKDRHWFGYDWNDDKVWTEFHYYSFCTASEGSDFGDYPHDQLASGVGRACLQQAIGQRKAPAWLKYGVRSYFSSWRIQDSIPANLEERYSRSEYLPVLKELAKKGLPSLGAFLERGSEYYKEGADEDKSENYALAESFADMLFGSKPGAKVLAEALTNLTSKSEDTPPLDEKTVQRLEPVWHAHIRRITQ